MAWLWALWAHLLVLRAAAAASSNISLPGCSDRCGNVSIPFPFGVGQGCFRDGFDITCNHTYSPSKAFVKTSNIELLDISLEQGQIRVYNTFIASECYGQSGVQLSHNFAYISLGNGAEYMFSDTRNKFTAIGCDTLAYIVGRNGNNYSSGCISICDSRSSVTNGSCAGMGCCQISIPKGLFFFQTQLQSYSNHTGVVDFNPCSYAFMVEEDSYDFSITDLPGLDFMKRYEKGVPVVLDWAMRNQSCKEAMHDTANYACLSSNSICYDSANGPGYLCNCSNGYHGNPYLPNGCIDINECELPDLYPCSEEYCSNLEGNYSCTCPPGTHGDPYRGKCLRDPEKFPLSLKLVTGFSLGFILILSSSMLAYIKYQRRKLAVEKDKFFKKNGGLLLFEEMRSKQIQTIKIFTKEDLERATNNFDNNRVIGHGGFGTVYKGILDDNRTVAIKKSKIIDDSQKEEFAKEMVILSQINHANVVKLLGCCLEVEVPMLVYEFISNGTLFDFIHAKNRRSPIPLDTRLQIAVESAEALAYLHSSASPPILHGDVKSLNILLDDNYTAKVSDFGASRLGAKDDLQFMTLVQGTLGYMDPEYFQTRQLTEKSDVYSFGIIILELITGKKAIYSDGSGEGKSLAYSCIGMMEAKKFGDILDEQIVSEADMELLQGVGQLAIQCLSVRGEERPTMKEVAEELQMFRKFKQHPWVKHNPEEIESLLPGSSNYSMTDSTGFQSLGGMTLIIGSGR